jgi:hypothetical protein
VSRRVWRVAWLYDSDEFQDENHEPVAVYHIGGSNTFNSYDLAKIYADTVAQSRKPVVCMDRHWNHDVAERDHIISKDHPIIRYSRRR